MGAKTPTIVKEKRIFTCSICQANFLTTRALNSHVMAKHSSANKQSEEKSKDEKKTAFVPPTSRVSKRILEQKKLGDEDMPNLKPQKIDRRKIGFECPKCLKLFPVYFSALKHIQKRHSDDLVKKDSTDTANLKPVEVEICTSCVQRVHKQHKCGEHQPGDDPSSKSDVGTYTCLGCERKFASVSSFDQHVASTHGNNCDVMDFKDINEFLQWKSAMESQVRVKYLTLSNTNNRQYYQCNYVSPKNSPNMTHLCPSVVIVRQKVHNGVQIHFYKKHHNHSCPEYKIPKKYINKFNADSSKSNIDVFDALLVNDDKDLYTKFKDLMKSVITQSAKVNVTSLKKLYDLALDMQSTLDKEDNINQSNIENKSINIIDNNDKKELVQESEKPDILDISANKSMTDDQISKVLEKPRTSERLKRKSGSFTPNIMKKKKMANKIQSETIETKHSLKENNSITNNISSPKVIMSPVSNSPSFNAEYEQFIGTTINKINNQNDNIKSPLITKKPRKNIVKTKIGQFIPSPEKQIKDISENVTSKKKSENMKSPLNSLPDLKLDVIDYEVVEQENDCNILVLKI